MNCKNCKASCVHKGEDYGGKCLVGYVPITNADKIRQKSDEDLAAWLEGLVKIAAHVGDTHLTRHGSNG